VKCILKRIRSCSVWWIAISNIGACVYAHTHTHTHTHTCTHTGLGGPFQAGPMWFTGSKHHLPSCEGSQVLKMLPPDIQFRDITFLSEPRREALSCYLTRWCVTSGNSIWHLWKTEFTQVLALRTCRMWFPFSNSSYGLEDGVSLCKALSHYSHL